LDNVNTTLPFFIITNKASKPVYCQNLIHNLNFTIVISELYIEEQFDRVIYLNPNYVVLDNIDFLCQQPLEICEEVKYNRSLFGYVAIYENGKYYVPQQSLNYYFWPLEYWASLYFVIGLLLIPITIFCLHKTIKFIFYLINKI
jgi:hypothetical protein